MLNWTWNAGITSDRYSIEICFAFDSTLIACLLLPIRKVSSFPCRNWSICYNLSAIYQLPYYLMRLRNAVFFASVNLFIYLSFFLFLYFLLWVYAVFVLIDLIGIDVTWWKNLSGPKANLRSWAGCSLSFHCKGFIFLTDPEKTFSIPIGTIIWLPSIIHDFKDWNFSILNVCHNFYLMTA